MHNAGDRICGRFELVRGELEGTGSPVFGEAWAALDLESGDVVRLVFLGDELIPDQERRSALHRSLEGALGHRDDVLVPLAFVGDEDDRIVVAYEGLYAGIALADVLADLDAGDRISEAGRFIVEVAHALALLHGRGLTHGALGIETIFVWERGNAVWEYGLAGACDPAAIAARAGDNLLAPEVRAGGAVSPASDVYCWAACVAIYVSGLPSDEAIARAREGALLPAAEALGSILKDALAESPSARPRSGGVILRRLVDVGLIALADATSDPDEEALTALAEAGLEPITMPSLPPEAAPAADAPREAPAAASSAPANAAPAAEAPQAPSTSASSVSAAPPEIREEPSPSALLRAPTATGVASSTSMLTAAIPDFDFPDDLGELEPPLPVGDLPLPNVGDLPPLPPSLDDFAVPPELELGSHDLASIDSQEPSGMVEAAQSSSDLDLPPPPATAFEDGDLAPMPPPKPGDAPPSALGSLVSAALDLSLPATTPPPRRPPPPPPPSFSDDEDLLAPPHLPGLDLPREPRPSASPPLPAQVVKGPARPSGPPPAAASRGPRVHVLSTPVSDSGVRPVDSSSGLRVETSALRPVESSGARAVEPPRSEVSEGAPSTAALVAVALSTGRPSLASAVDSAVAPEPDAPILRRDRRTHPLGWDVSEIHAHATVPPDGSPAGASPAASASASGEQAQDSAILDTAAIVEATSVPVQPGAKAESDNRLLLVMALLTVVVVIVLMLR